MTRRYERTSPQLTLGGVTETTNAGVGDEHDFYPTPAWVTLAILPHLRSFHSALDPCCGDGGILGALPSRVLRKGLEIDPVRARRCRERFMIEPTICDSLEEGFRWPSVDLVIQNPPFELAIEFVRAALRFLHAGGCFEVAVLLRLAFLETKERAQFHRENPSDVYPLATRPAFIDPKALRPCPKCKGRCGDLAYDPPIKCATCNGRGEVKGGTDSSAYAWFVWPPRPAPFGHDRRGHVYVLDDVDPARKPQKPRRA